MTAYMTQKSTRLLCGLAILTTGLILTGCKSPVALLPEETSDRDTRVVLTCGDEIDIRFFYTPELNDVQHIRPDGKITLQLLGDVTASGHTPAQLQKALEQKYTGLIEKPSVAVITRELAHRNVYVTGSVIEPGLQPMPGHTTALAAVMKAGGFDMRSADAKKVLVVRHEDGSRKTYELNLKDRLRGEADRDPFYLHAQDIVYVPRTGVVRTAQWIDQYITQMIPKTGFSLFYDSNTGNSVIGVDTTSKY